MYCFNIFAPGEDVKRKNAARRALTGISGKTVPRIRSLNFTENSALGKRPVWAADKKGLHLNRETMWFPSQDARSAEWGGAGNISALVKEMKIEKNLFKIVVEVRDDCWVPMQKDGSGDSFKLSTGKTVFHMGIDNRLKPILKGNLGYGRISNYRCRFTGKDTIEYTLEMKDWRGYSLFRIYPSRKNEVTNTVSMGFQFQDDDGKGLRGALVWPRPSDWGLVRY
jgi:hypothetical protein